MRAAAATATLAGDLETSGCEDASESTVLVASNSQLGAGNGEVATTKDGSSILQAEHAQSLICHLELEITPRLVMTVLLAALAAIALLVLVTSAGEWDRPASSVPSTASGPLLLPASSESCGDHATASSGACVCELGYIHDPVRQHADDELACRSCGPQGTFTVVGGVRRCACADTGQVPNNFQGEFCDLPPGLHISGATFSDGVEATINGHLIDGLYDRHQTTTCNGKPVYEHSGTFGTAGAGVVVYQPAGHDGTWVLAAGENAEEGAPLCSAQGVFVLCSASSPVRELGSSHTWYRVHAGRLNCTNATHAAVSSIRVVSRSTDQEGLLGF